MDPGFLIGEDDAARLAAMLTSFECGKLGAVPVSPVNPASADQQAVIFAKVTSATPSYSYYYPAKRVYRHNGDWVEAEAIWLRGLNGEVLENGKYYEARFFNMSPTLDPSPIYAVNVPQSARAASVIRAAYLSGYSGIWVGSLMSFYYGSTNWVGDGGLCYFMELNAGNPYGDPNLWYKITPGKQYQGTFLNSYISGYPLYGVYVENPPTGGAGTGGTPGTEPIV